MNVNYATLRVHEINNILENYPDEKIENDNYLMDLVEEKQQLTEDFYIDKNYLTKCSDLGI